MKMIKSKCAVCTASYKYEEKNGDPFVCSKRSCKIQRDKVFEKIAKQQKSIRAFNRKENENQMQ